METRGISGLLTEWILVCQDVKLGKVLGPYDYTNDLSKRVILERLMAETPTDVTDDHRTRLAAADQTFIESTDPWATIGQDFPVELSWLARKPKVLEPDIEADFSSY